MSAYQANQPPVYTPPQAYPSYGTVQQPIYTQPPGYPYPSAPQPDLKAPSAPAYNPGYVSAQPGPSYGYTQLQYPPPQQQMYTQSPYSAASSQQYSPYGQQQQEHGPWTDKQPLTAPTQSTQTVVVTEHHHCHGQDRPARDLCCCGLGACLCCCCADDCADCGEAICCFPCNFINAVFSCLCCCCAD